MTKRSQHGLTARLLSFLLVFLLVLALSLPAFGADLGRQQMLVNKTHTLSPDYVPSQLVYLSNYMSAGGSVMMRQDAAIAMGRMVQAAAREGVTGFYGQSGYRSYSLQSSLYQNNIYAYRSMGYGDRSEYMAAQEVAPPGASEHQTGMALDISTAETGYTLEEDFGDTTVGRWLNANSWKYGFILRYPKDKTAVTGYIFEPWHFRYVGAPHAEYMYRNGLCLEEYYDLLKRQGSLEYTTLNGYSYTIYYSATDISGQLGDSGVVTCLSVADPAISGYLITVRPTLYDLEGHWSEDEVRSLASYGVVKGYPDGTFRPYGNINRAELVAMVDRTWDLLFEDRELAGETTVFTDVLPSDYYFTSLMKMYEAGLVASSLVEEDENGQLTFNGMEPVLRYQAAESLAPLFRALPEVTGSAELLDMYNQSAELREAVQVLVDYGVVKGDDKGRFNPDQRITRAEIAAMLDRIIKYYNVGDE
ncbi:MAG: D-alanyl-D-alanine carboxypeptidase family protein [Firmicutes bacterium]|nr:D-alanyl-D-alanine carboxypeptidase family protein [Bacillota bacterium]